METPNFAPEDWEELYIQYSLGSLEPDERARFEESLAECRNREQIAATYSQMLGLLGTVAATAEPPLGHKSRLMARVAATPQATPGLDDTARPHPLFLPQNGPAAPVDRQKVREVPALSRPRGLGARLLSGAVAAALVVLLGGWLLLTMSGEIERQSNRIAEVEGRLEAVQGQVNIPPGYRAIALAPTSEYTGVSALVLYKPGASEAWLVADGLYALPDDLIYELWLMQPAGRGQSEVGGVFSATQDGTAVHRTETQKTIADYAGFAVSIERKPGVPVREGPVVMVGRFETP